MMTRTMMTPALEKHLGTSSATDDFKAALLAYAESKTVTPLIKANAGAPPVKILRVITKLLEDFPGEAIEAVEVEGSSGCSDFRGTLKVRGGEIGTIRFVWDCAWKAREVGYKDHWGDADQQRAAAEFGYDCFEVFEKA